MVLYVQVFGVFMWCYTYKCLGCLYGVIRTSVWGVNMVLYVKCLGCLCGVIRTSVWGVYVVLYVQVFGVFIWCYTYKCLGCLLRFLFFVGNMCCLILFIVVMSAQNLLIIV